MRTTFKPRVGIAVMALAMLRPSQPSKAKLLPIPRRSRLRQQEPWAFGGHIILNAGGDDHPNAAEQTSMPLPDNRVLIVNKADTPPQH